MGKKETLIETKETDVKGKVFPTLRRFQVEAAGNRRFFSIQQSIEIVDPSFPSVESTNGDIRPRNRFDEGCEWLRSKE